MALILHHKDTARIAPDVSLATIRKAAPAHPDDCLASTRDASGLQVDGRDRYFIENNVVAHINNVPAGTNVDVHLHTYNGTTAAGSAMYDKPYGTYNFTAQKIYPHAGNTYVGGWRITGFVVCKR